jgi:hypothetical protein
MGGFCPWCLFNADFHILGYKGIGCAGGVSRAMPVIMLLRTWTMSLITVYFVARYPTFAHAAAASHFVDIKAHNGPLNKHSQ